MSSGRLGANISLSVSLFHCYQNHQFTDNRFQTMNDWLAIFKLATGIEHSKFFDPKSNRAKSSTSQLREYHFAYINFTFYSFSNDSLFTLIF
jgi:hypothetical protein